MRRRKKTGKGRRQKALRSRSASKAARHCGPVADREKTNSAQFRRERDEALEQLAATSEVLKVISSSPGHLQPVFDTMLQSAVRICGAKFGHLWLRDGDVFRIGATYGAPQAFVDYLRSEPTHRPKPETGLGQLLKHKKLFHLADLTALPTHGDKLREATINLAGARTLVGVPAVKDNEVIGAIVI